MHISCPMPIKTHDDCRPLVKNLAPQPQGRRQQHFCPAPTGYASALMGPGEQKAGWRPVLNACTCASISVAMGLRALLFASLMQCCNIKKSFSILCNSRL